MQKDLIWHAAQGYLRGYVLNKIRVQMPDQHRRAMAEAFAAIRTSRAGHMIQMNFQVLALMGVQEKPQETLPKALLKLIRGAEDEVVDHLPEMFECGRRAGIGRADTLRAGTVAFLGAFWLEGGGVIPRGEEVSSDKSLELARQMILASEEGKKAFTKEVDAFPRFYRLATMGQVPHLDAQVLLQEVLVP